MSTAPRASAPPMPSETPLRPPSPESPLSSMSSAGSTLYDSPPTRQTALGAYIFPAVKQEEEPNAWLHPQNPVPRPAPHYRRQSRPSYEFPATGGGGDYAQSMERGSYQAKRLSITGMSTYEAAVRGGEGGYSALGRQVVEGGGIGRTYSWSAYPDFGVSTEHHDGGHPGYSTTSTHSYSHYYAADARLVQPTPAPPPPPQQQYPTTTQFQWAPPPPPAPAPPLHHHHSYTSDYGGSPEDHYRPLPHPDHRQGVYLQTGPGRPFVYGTSLAPPAHYVPYTPASSHHMVRSSGHSYHHQALGAGGYDGVVYGGHGEHERESSSGGYGQQSCDPSHISDEPRSPYIYAGGGADGGERPGYTGVGTSLYDRSTHDHDSPRSVPRSSTRPLRTTRRALPPSRSRSSTPPTPARRSKSKIYHPPPSASSTTSTAFHMPSLPTDAQFAIMPTKRSRGRRPPEALEAIDVQYDDKKRGKAPKMFLCKVPRCGKWFKRSEHLKRHVRSIHTDEKPFQCQWPGCAKYFSRHDNLNQHLRVHRVPGTTDLDFSVQLEACFGPGGVRGDKALGLTESARDSKEEKGEESWDSE